MVESSFYKQNTMPDLITGESETPLPASIGPYKIESLLNKGGMSLLYLGLDPETKKPLAIKVLSPSYVNHPETVGRFLKEARVIALTNHPNIVKL
jgi:eukaryotic-like serine/threonine-protein kinase